MTESEYAFKKINKITALQATDHDVVDRLRKTRLGQVYRNHLRKYRAIHGAIQWLWRNGYPIYVNYIAIYLTNSEKIKWQPLIKLSEFTRKSGAVTHKLVDTTFVETPKPRTVPKGDQDYLASPHDRYRFPDIFFTKISNTTIYGGTNLILTKDEVVCHDLYDFERDYTSEEMHGRTLIDPKSCRIRWLLNDKAPETITDAATFIDACAPNYAHWMTEVLPRIALFCSEEQFKDIPIVINDGLHPNIMESLLLVAGADREIILLPIGRALLVNTLYLTSVAGYVPFERRTNKLTGHSHGVFSPQAFEKIRTKLIPVAERVSNDDWPKKIYLKRNSGGRKIINAHEIERLLISSGFCIIYPERLNFLEQVQLFSNAQIIFAASGAALANIIFCPPTTKISIFISKYPETSYWYWQNIATASGKVIEYLLGEIPDTNAQSIHADFYISPDQILRSLSQGGRP